jgi:O-antigen/teichoic acid export membrane protein
LHTIRNRILRGVGANAFGNLVGIVIQLASVPVFLHCWGVQIYGEWLILSALPGYFLLSDIGFTDAAANDMTMLVSNGKREQALEVFQTIWLIITFVSIALFCIISSIIWFIPLEQWLNLSHQFHYEISLIVIVLSLYTFLHLQIGVVYAGLRCDGNYALGVFIINTVRLLGSLALLAVVLAGGSQLDAAASLLICEVLALIYIRYKLKTSSPWLTYGIIHARWSRVRTLTIPALAFIGFPIGYALGNQGILIVISSILSPSAVVTFSTLRTISRFPFQIVAGFIGSFRPEISIAYGSGDLLLARKLHCYVCQISIWTSTLIASLLFFLGPFILRLWTQEKVNMDIYAFNIILLVIIANSLWLASASVPLAINKHGKLSVSFVTTYVCSIAVAPFLTVKFGLVGTSISIILPESFMVFFAIKISLSLLEDDFFSFAKMIFRVPSFTSMK